jgi:hypothetical protein
MALGVPVAHGVQAVPVPVKADPAPVKPRIIVLSDIGNEPDDPKALCAFCSMRMNSMSRG